ncbi:MAG: carboxypeptidase-like regulatory domain-containing protein, partial [Acidobacteriaceae bacterium]
MNKLIAVLLICMASASAQEFRGSLTGQVTDPAGAAVANAAVLVTSIQTGAVSKTTTTGQGYYTVPFLAPGSYTLQVTAPGFARYLEPSVEIQTQQNATVNVHLTVGAVSQSVTVSAAEPMIDTADASTGQVLTTEQVQDLPSNGQSPLGFARIEYGAVSKAKHAVAQALPYNNSTVDDFSLGGGLSSSNELLLNGVPNMEDGSRTAGFSPSMDSVNEIRVDEFNANAAIGDTSGGTVNITTKSGTNQFHGAARWFYQGAGCSGLDGNFASRSANNCSWFAALPYSQKVNGAVPSATHQNFFTGTIGGPVWIPKVFNGRNKLFFFYSYEATVGQQPPAQTIGDVPTAAERQGDFSALLGLGSTYQLYNPNSASGTTTTYKRTAIPNNCLTGGSANCSVNAGLTLDPVALALLKYIPLPNYNGPTTKADGENNYFAYTPVINDYRSHMGRIDYNISTTNKIFGEAHRSRYINSQSNYFNDIASGTTSDIILFGGVVDDIETFSPTLALDTRLGMSRYDSSNSEPSSGFNPASVGFPGYLGTNSTALAMPHIQFTDATSPLGISTTPGSLENFDTIQFYSMLTKVKGRHTIIGGVDIRANKGSYLTPTNADGLFQFQNSTGNAVSQCSSNQSSCDAAPKFGSAFALFMLGLPTAGSYTVAAPFQFNNFYNAFFIQDDWKATSDFTVSAGIRFEHETPVTESNNRMVNGWIPTTANEATGPAEAAYQSIYSKTTPAPLVSPSAFQPTGGITFASSSNRYAYHTAPLYYSPRIGLSWSPSALRHKAVFRAGFGVYVNPFGDYNQGQSYGYTGTTTFVTSNNNGFTPLSWDDPFPTASNPIQLPTGNALGVNTDLGQAIKFYAPVKVPYSERSSLDVQYQLSHNMIAEIGYVNDDEVHLSYSNQISSTPLVPYLCRCAKQNAATQAELNATVTNPFKGLTGMTGSLATNSTIPEATLLQSYPEYSSVTASLEPGATANFNALLARFYRQMSHGFTLNANFEWSRLLGYFGQLNPGDVLNYQETSSDYPYNLSIYGTYQLPFGQGRAWLNQNRWYNNAIGGWQVSGIYHFLSGMPIQWGNAIYTGSGWNDFHNVQHSSANVLGQKVFNTSAF